MKLGIFSVFAALFATAYSGWYYFMASKAEPIKRKNPQNSTLSFNLTRGRRGFYIMTTWISIASVYLWYLIFTHQFQVDYIYRYTSRDLGIGYLLSAFWAGQEGSFLLWTLMIAIMGVAFMRNARNLEAYAMLFLNIIQAGFILLLIKASPFTLQQTIPLDGAGLNPLLQNPWMVIHPPILFLGYASTSIPFVIALAALVKRDFTNWVKIEFPWALFASVTMGAGIIIGAYWAYKVLGWGGYWGWDPVENSSLIAWLSVLALFHALLVTRFRGGFQKSSFALSILSFVFVLYATFLTRSGVLADFSVHSFEDLGINGFLTLYLAASLFFGFAILYVRRKETPYVFIQYSSPTKENILVVSVMILMTSAFFILLGTSSPIISKLFGPSSQVDTSFYNRINLPIAILISLSLGIAPILTWKTEPFKTIAGKLIFSAVTALAIAVIGVWSGMHKALNIIFLASIAFALTSNILVFLQKAKLGWRAVIAPFSHIGVALMFAGIIVSGVFDSSQRTILTKNVHKSALGYDLVYKGGFKSPDGKDGALIELHGNDIKTLAKPRLYMNNYSRGEMREPFVDEGILNDLYISPLQVIDNKTASPVNELIIREGEKKQFAGYDIVFKNFELNSHEESKMFKVAAVLQMAKDDQTFEVSPAFILNGNEKTVLPASMPNAGKNIPKSHISLQGVNAEKRTVKLAFEGFPAIKTSENKPAQIVIEISKKPFMTILWIGTIILTLGSLLAMKRRSAELQISSTHER